MGMHSLWAIYIKLILAAFFWGGTFVAGKLLTSSTGPFSAAFLRFLIASFFLIIIVIKVEGKISIPAKKQILPIFLLGLTGVFFYNYCFFSGLKYIEAGRASVIVANNPILIALFSAYFFKEKLTPLKIAGIIISISGAIVVITKGNIIELFQDSIEAGELFIFGAVASWVVYTLIGKTLMKNLSAILSVTYSVLAGTLLLIIPASIEGVFATIPTLTFIDWASFVYLGLFGTVLAFIFYYQGIVEIGPTKAGLFINFVPVSGVILSFLILKEPITISLLLGVILVSLGIYLTNKNPKRV
jgi:drug/metabolite transporter (DMT)-like permease